MRCLQLIQNALTRVKLLGPVILEVIVEAGAYNIKLKSTDNGSQERQENCQESIKQIDRGSKATTRDYQC